jgi:hypothetical protein
MRKTGGLLCVPAFADFGGTLDYPRTVPAGSVTVTSSTTDLDTLPTDGGSPIFYIQFATTAPTTFGKSLLKPGAFAGKAIKAGKTYTIFGAAKSGGVAIIITHLGACYEVATAGTNGGRLASLGAVLEGQKLTSPATIAVEVYAKKMATKKC